MIAGTGLTTVTLLKSRLLDFKGIGYSPTESASLKTFVGGERERSAPYFD
jgi:hypothetical protein